MPAISRNALHELRTPLTSILGEAEIILSQPRLAREYEASIQVMQQEARKLDDLTASLTASFAGSTTTDRKQSIEEVGLEEILLQAKKRYVDKRMPGNRVRIMVPDVPGIHPMPFAWHAAVCGWSWP